MAVKGERQVTPPELGVRFVEQEIVVRVKEGLGRGESLGGKWTYRCRRGWLLVEGEGTKMWTGNLRRKLAVS